uniref:Uncharacterized protein n=1 Tax=Meloidogyne floridensis TaxID=298350 RepID=A0A915P3Z9_9BILA
MNKLFLLFTLFIVIIVAIECAVKPPACKKPPCKPPPKPPACKKPPCKPPPKPPACKKPPCKPPISSCDVFDCKNACRLKCKKLDKICLAKLGACVTRKCCIVG